MKPTATRLLIRKNNDIDTHDQVTYRFEWYDGQNLLFREILKLDTADGSPVEHYDINNMIDHKIHCCLTIDKTTFTVENSNA